MNIEFFLTLIVELTLLFALWYFFFQRPRNREKERKIKINFLLNDTTRPEETRRGELVKMLAMEGHSIALQQRGLVQIVVQKKSFSILLFLLLLLAGGLPGILYLVWFITKKPETGAYVFIE